jgi:YidC/Oxa1 family membrane protein insertase
MNSDHRNMIAAIALSMLILIVYQIYFIPDAPPPDEGGRTSANLDNSGRTSGTNTDETGTSEAPRVSIESGSLEGSISLAGGRIDDLRLTKFGEETLDDQIHVALLRKSGGEDSYFAEIDFLDENNGRLVQRGARWNADSNLLTPSRPLTLRHRSAEGIDFAITYEMDDQYLITMTAAVTNNSGNALNIRHLARMLRNKPSDNAFFISYEGPIGVFEEDVKKEYKYGDIEDLQEGNAASFTSDGVRGWIGITDKYWLTALVPDEQDDVTFSFRRANGAGIRTQVDALTEPVRLGAGETISRSFALFAGPKEVDVLLGYSESAGIQRLDHAIDWGWFPFLTKPFFHALNWMSDLFGNFGLAIIGLTVIVKLVFFPLANRSYKSMAKMRELAPKVQELRERFGDDKQRQQQEMMQLYRAEKVNPAAGCLPILLQIPVFFALYKVLFINIEMRHAPFYGWIDDLSALDPTSILNLFGLLPYNTAIFPDFLNLGIWPILMGISMFVQMSLNPPPPDPIQAKIFKFMPIFFTFLLATFPAGLVIYWTWNNVLSIIQQWLIMQSVKKAKTA